MAGEDQSFVCGGCEALSQQRNVPPRTSHPDCTRCGDPTRQYIGAVIAGRAVLITPGEYESAARFGKRVPDTPGVRVIHGIEMYSAGWL